VSLASTHSMPGASPVVIATSVPRHCLGSLAGTATPRREPGLSLYPAAAAVLALSSPFPLSSLPLRARGSCLQTVPCLHSSIQVLHCCLSALPSPGTRRADTHAHPAHEDGQSSWLLQSLSPCRSLPRLPRGSTSIPLQSPYPATPHPIS
jgi:hypothetical protein